MIESKHHMNIVDRVSSLRIGRNGSPDAKEMTHIRDTRSRSEIQTANGIVRSVKEAKVFVQELGTYPVRELGGRYSFGIAFGTIIR